VVSERTLGPHGACGREAELENMILWGYSKQHIRKAAALPTSLFDLTINHAYSNAYQGECTLTRDDALLLRLR
jgi:hypothetical protein